MNLKELRLIVQKYINNYQASLDRYLSYYKKLASLDEVIEKSALAITASGKRHSHQRRVKKSALRKTADTLLSRKKKVGSCNDFAELIELVNSCAVKGFGELAVYDTSLRIGAYLGIFPRKIYLHAGTKKGARALNLDTSKPYINKSQLPRVFQGLKPHELEDLLCIYKGRIKGRSCSVPPGCGPRC